MCHYFWFRIKDSHSSVTYYCCMLCLVSLVKLLIFGHYLWPFLGKLSREIIFISFYLSVKYILQCADQGRGKLDDLHQDPLLVVVVAVLRCNFLKHQWGKYLCIKDLIHHGDFQGKGFKMAPRSDKSELHNTLF